MSEGSYKSIVIDAVNEKIDVSIKQFNNTDINKSRSLFDFLDLYSKMIEIINNKPPDNYVKTVYVSVSGSTVIDLDYEYSDIMIPAHKIGFIIDNDWTTRLSKQ